MLMQRRTRTSKLLEPKVLPSIHEKLKLKQQTQNKFFDRGTKELPILKEGEKVKMRMQHKLWKDAVVVKKKVFSLEATLYSMKENSTVETE